MILVRASIELDYQVELEAQDSGAYLVTFPGFPEIKPLAFPSAPHDDTMKHAAKRAVEEAIYIRVKCGEALPRQWRR